MACPAQSSTPSIPRYHHYSSSATPGHSWHAPLSSLGGAHYSKGGQTRGAGCGTLLSTLVIQTGACCMELGQAYADTLPANHRQALSEAGVVLIDVTLS